MHIEVPQPFYIDPIQKNILLNWIVCFFVRIFKLFHRQDTAHNVDVKKKWSYKGFKKIYSFFRIEDIYLFIPLRFASQRSFCMLLEID